MKRFISVFVLVTVMATATFAFSANPTTDIEDSAIFIEWSSVMTGWLYWEGKFQGRVYYFTDNDFRSTHEVYAVWIDWNPNTERWEQEEVTDLYLSLYDSTVEAYTTQFDINNLGAAYSMQKIDEYTYDVEYYNEGEVIWVRYRFEKYIEQFDYWLVSREQRRGGF